MGVVVGRDLLAEVANPLLQLVLVDDDPTDIRVVHVVAGSALSQRKRRVPVVTRTRWSIR